MSKLFKTIREINDPLKTAGRDDRELVLEAIESLKRWIYREGYKGPINEPAPTTEDEFSLLMDGLRRWAILHAPHIDTGRLQDYRRAELDLPDACGAVRVFPNQFAEREWWQVAFKADDVLNELKTLLQMDGEVKLPKDPARHSPDFRSVHWYGIDFTFTAKQAACVKMLWEAWENGTPEVGNETLLADAEAQTNRLDHLFNNRKHPAFGNMIQAGSTKGTSRLAPPSGK